MTNRDDITINAEISQLKSQLNDLLARQAKTEGTVEQLNKSIAAGNRMTNWQFIGFVLVMAGTLFGTLYWSTGVMEKRLEQMEINNKERTEEIKQRFEQMERNNKERTEEIKQRFEDLKQVVLSKR